MDKKLTDLQPGQKYYVQVRAKKKNDPEIISQWSKPFAFTTTNDLVAPKPVTNLDLTSEGSSFVAKWDAPTQNADNSTLKDLKGYNIVFVNADNPTEKSNPIFTSEKSFTLTFDQNVSLFGAPRGHLTLEVKAVDLIGNESTKVSDTAQNPVPANVTNLAAEPLLEAISVTWDANPESDIHHYELFVSTAGSGYTPGPATRRYAGPNTAFLITSSNPVPHYIKVVAVDIFGQPSAVPSLVVETPRTTTTVDNTPPGPPTGITVASITDGVSSAVKLGWTAPADVDIDHYVIRYGVNTTEWAYISAPADVAEALIRNLKSNTAYYIGIKTVDFNANSSNWVNAGSYPYTTAADTTPPNKPSAPDVATSVLKAQITHDMQDDTATNLAADTEYIEVYADTTAGFTCQPGNQVDKIKTAGVGVSVSTLVTYPTATNLYWKVIAVDTSGNKSVASDATLGTPSLISNAYIENATITDAKIANLSATKLVAGTAFINDLFIRSNLTIDNASGAILSDDYNAGAKTGWKIDRNGIVIYEGSIKASALEIQDSQNIIAPPFADFEFNDEWYFNSTNDANTLNMYTNTASTKFAKVLSGNKYGTQHLKMYNTTGAANNWFYFGTSASNYNVQVDGLNTYIASIWVKNNLGTPKDFTINIVTDGGQTFTATQTIPNGGLWNRVSVECATNSSTTALLMYVGTSVNTPIDFGLDGAQIERKIGSLSTPGPWTPPGSTKISGESIVTGSIKSSASAAGIPTQPAWSLNTAGNAQFGDALVRGNLTVGAGGDTANSTMKSANYAAGTTGWIVKGDGSVEFNSGTFRGNLLIERTISGLTTNLRAGTVNQRFYPKPWGYGSTYSNIENNTPVISGQSYGYNRILNGTTGKWEPTTQNADRKMRYFIGPTTDRSVLIQTNDRDVDAVFAGTQDEWPLNHTVATGKYGEVAEYFSPQKQYEATGWTNIASKWDAIGPKSYDVNNNEYTYLHPISGVVTPSYRSPVQVFDQGAILPVSPFAPEYLTNKVENTGTFQGSAKVYSHSASRTMAVSSSMASFNKNLLSEPYCTTLHPTLTFDGTTTYNDLQGTGTAQINTSGTANNIGCTASVEPGMYTDMNYKTPAYLVNWSVNQNSASRIYLTNNVVGSNPGTWQYYVNAIRRGKTYILSVFMRTNLPGSSTSGVQGPPLADFNMKIGLRCRTSGTTPGYIDVEGTVLVPVGKDSVRVSVPITPPAGTPELNQAIMYFEFPGQATLNRQVMITHPQVEERVWSSHPNPLVAASNMPTAWSTSQYSTTNSNAIAINMVTQSTADYRFEAYGRNARNNQLFSDINQYQVADVKTFRDAPSYLEIKIQRDALITSNPYTGDTKTTTYRFSEAGLQFPTSFEPYLPAGVQTGMNNRVLPAGSPPGTADVQINLLEHAYSNGEIILGEDIRRFNSTTSYIVDRAGFYTMFMNVRIAFSGPDAMWFDWKVTNASGTFTLSKQAVGRAGVWEAGTSLMRYLQRDDIITVFLVSAAANTAPHDITDILFAMARIN